jgi:hypothetical protein
MDKVQNDDSFKCNTPSSEPFRINKIEAKKFRLFQRGAPNNLHQQQMDTGANEAYKILNNTFGESVYSKQD